MGGRASRQQCCRSCRPARWQRSWLAATAGAQLGWQLRSARACTGRRRCCMSWAWQVCQRMLLIHPPTAYALSQPPYPPPDAWPHVRACHSCRQGLTGTSRCLWRRVPRRRLQHSRCAGAAAAGRRQSAAERRRGRGGGGARDRGLPGVGPCRCARRLGGVARTPAARQLPRAAAPGRRRSTAGVAAAGRP